MVQFWISLIECEASLWVALDDHILAFHFPCSCPPVLQTAACSPAVLPLCGKNARADSCLTCWLCLSSLVSSSTQATKVYLPTNPVSMETNA